jgi:hypothetical protein
MFGVFVVMLSSLVRLAAVSQLAPGAGTGLPARLGSRTAEEPGHSTPPTMKKPRRVRRG